MVEVGAADQIQLCLDFTNPKNRNHIQMKKILQDLLRFAMLVVAMCRMMQVLGVAARQVDIKNQVY